MYKRLYALGIAAYLVMFVLALVFYKERMIFLDASFILFHVVKDGSFCIQVYRFGDALMQLLPLLAVKAGQPLSTIARSFSISPVAIYFTTYLLCGSLLKQYRLAIGILLVHVLFTAYSFYWPISQVPQGIAFILLILAMINGRPVNSIKPLMWLALGLLLVLLAFFHPLMIVIIAYTYFFFLLQKDSALPTRLLGMLTAVFFAALIIKMMLFNSSYDRHSLSGLKNFVRLYPNYFSTYANSMLLHNCLTKYYWVPLLSAGISIYYTVTRQWKKLLLLAASVLGYLFVVNVVYATAATPPFYIENLYLPIAFFIVLPLLYDLVPVLETRKLALPLLSLIIITGCVRMYTTHTPYTARLGYERQLLDTYGGKKIILNSKAVNAGMLQEVWGSAYEFYLLSMIEKGRPASILIDENPLRFEWSARNSKAIVVTTDIFLYSALPKVYFPFTDTTSTYAVDTATYK